MPALNPVKTGSEMKLARNPSLSRPARIRKAPVSWASIEAEAMRCAVSPPGTAMASSAAVSLPIVLVGSAHIPVLSQIRSFPIHIVSSLCLMQHQHKLHQFSRHSLKFRYKAKLTQAR